MRTPDKIQPYLTSLTTDFERRPLAEQIIDQLLAEDSKRYQKYEELKLQVAREGRPFTQQADHKNQQTHAAIGKFMASWIEFEREVRKQVTSKFGVDQYLIPTSRLIGRLWHFDKDTLNEIDRVRRFRNNLVHGVESPEIADISDATQLLDNFLKRMKPRHAQRRTAKRSKTKK